MVIKDKNRTKEMNLVVRHLKIRDSHIKIHLNTDLIQKYNKEKVRLLPNLIRNKGKVVLRIIIYQKINN